MVRAGRSILLFAVYVQVCVCVGSGRGFDKTQEKDAERWTYVSVLASRG